MDKTKAFKEEIKKIDEEIESLKMVRISLLGYISVEKIRLLVDDFEDKNNE